MDRQNELIRALQDQLEAKERELANQKWVFERFLESPAWRMTYPVRWMTRQVRKIWQWVVPGSQSFPAQTRRGEEPRQDLGWGRVDQEEYSSDKHHSGPSLEASPYQVSASPPLPSSSEEGSYSFSPAVKEFLTASYRASFERFLMKNIPLSLPQSENPAVSIILVLYNRAELTLQCLRSIAEQSFDSLEVIIVDNGSTDDTAKMLDRLQGPRIIRNSENRNFLLAVNQAAGRARGEYILLLNNDAQLLPATLFSALNTIRSAPNIGAVGGRLIFLDWTLQEAGSIIWRDGSCLGYGRGDNPFAPMYMFRRDVDYCSAAFLLTAHAIWRQLGGFDETFSPAYYEDSDYCARLWEHGFHVVYDPNAVVLHYEFGSSTQASKAIDLQRKHQKLFASRHEAWLSNHHVRSEGRILAARSQNTKPRILFLDDRIPHPWLGTGFPRARNILLSLVKQGFFVTFYPLTEFDETWGSVYSDMPPEVEFITGYGPKLLGAFLQSSHAYYDTIFVSRPHNMKILQPILCGHEEWFRNTHIIYDAEALFTSRAIALAQLKGSPLSSDEAEKMLGEEVALAAMAKTVIAVSESERKQFEKYGIQAVHILGHSVVPAPTRRPFRERKGFLFAGPIHEASPNEDSMIWFLEEVFPRVQARLGGVELTMAGINRSEALRQLAGTEVRMTGPVADLSSFYDSARVFIAPTRYSAGIPQKIHDAAARGLPIVATPLLASQLGWEDGTPLLTAADAEGFAAKCVELYTSEALWNRLRACGIEWIRKDCSPELFENKLQAIIENGHRGQAWENA